MLITRSISMRLVRGISQAALALVVTAGLARANEFPAVIQASALDGTAGFIMLGAGAEDNAGYAIAPVGDVNGDGFDDVVVGAPYADPSGLVDGGSAYVVFGKAGGFGPLLDLATLNGANGFRINAEAAGFDIGHAVGGGDVNGDGVSDIILAQDNGAIGGIQGGGVYVVFGKRGNFASALSLSTLNGKNGFRIAHGTANARLGDGVDVAGDVNNDGFNDILIGARGGGAGAGEAFVVFGKASGFPSVLKVSSLNGTNGFRLAGATIQDRTGSAVGHAGDVNGDGISDLMVGAPYAIGGAQSGRTYVVFGKSTPFASKIDLSNLGGANGFRIDAAATGDRSGSVVLSAGDQNGDGIDDMFVGSPRSDSTASEAGSGYVVFGKSTLFASALQLSALASADGRRLDGYEANSMSSNSGGSAGDVNGDGFDDTIVGASSLDANATDSGGAYVVFGGATGLPSTLNLSTLDGTNGFRIEGISQDDNAGAASRSAGDINGDGFADVMLGTPFSDLNGYDTGSVFIVYGRAPDAAVSRTGSAASQYMSGGSDIDALSGLAGDDELEGRAGGDSLNGGGDNDTATYLHAPTGLTASLISPASNTGDAAGDSYASVENLRGSRSNDVLTGDGATNILAGENGADQLDGGDSGDTLIGGRGADIQTGGLGNDTFKYQLALESPAGAGRDTITDFNPGSGTTAVDKIDLATIDADSRKAGNQKFKFIGTAAFSKKPAELRLKSSSSGAIVQADTNGDGKADLEIKLQGVTVLGKLKANDFLL